MNKGFYGFPKNRTYEVPTSASYAVTASYISPTFISASAAAAGFGSGGTNIDTSSFVTNSQTSSFVKNSQTSSFITTTQTSSFLLNSQTGSMLSPYTLNSQTSSFVLNSQTSSFVTNSQTSSFVTNNQTSSFVLNTQTGSFLTTGSTNSTQTVLGSLVINQNLTVLGSSSIQTISSSTLNIGTNLITVNTINPAARFGGLAVIDSGSSPQVSGSLLFDSQENQWIFIHQNQGVITSSMLIMGPETYDSVGNETHLTQNRLMKSVNDEHIGDSNITDTGTIVSINSDTQITGSLVITGSSGLTVLGPAAFKASGSNVNAIQVQSSDWIAGSKGVALAINAPSGTTSATLLVRTNGGMGAGDLALGSGTSLVGTVSGSLIGSASYATTASYVAGYVTNSQTGSFIVNNQTGSFAVTGSNIFIGNQTITGSLLISGSAGSTLNGIVLSQSTAINQFIRSTPNNLDIALSSSAGDRGIRIFATNALTATPNGAAIQFYSSDHTGQPGNFYVDSGAATTAGIIFRTTIAAGTITERMRITATGVVQISGSVNSSGSFSLSGSLSTSGSISNVGQSVLFTPRMVATSPSQSFFNITGSLQNTGSTIGSQVYGVNINPLMIYATGSQTQTAFRVAPQFSGSSAFTSSQSNIVADFGAVGVGTQFSVNDITSGSIYLVNDISGLPIIEALSDWTVNMYNYPTRVFQKTGSAIIISASMNISGSLTMAPSSSFILPLTASSAPAIGSAYWSGSFLFVYNGTRYMSASFF